MSQPAKKTAAKKSAAKKTSSSSSSVEVKLGQQVFVDVDPKLNNGASQAVGTVVHVLDTDEPRVNLQVLHDGADVQYLRNVLVLSSRDDEDEATEDGGRVAFTDAD